MEPFLNFLKLLLERNVYVAAGMLLALLLFAVRLVGGAETLDAQIVSIVYLAGTFCLLVITIQLALFLYGKSRDAISAHLRARKAMQSLSLHHRYCLLYMKAHGVKSVSDLDYTPLKDMVAIGLMTSPQSAVVLSGNARAFELVPFVWKEISKPGWGSDLQVPAAPPWNPVSFPPEVIQQMQGCRVAGPAAR